MTPYEGSNPYIFISYSHKDTDEVLSVINALERNGFRVWFDAGVEAGSEWPEYIASHLRKSACVLAFISPNFVSSVNCRRELTFAQNLNVPMLNVYLSEVELSDGLQMQLGLNQCIFRNKFSVQEDFEEAVCRAEMLKDCRFAAGEQEAAAATRPQVITENRDTPTDKVPTLQLENKKAPLGHKGRRTFLSWTTSLLQLSYGFTGILAIDHVTKYAKTGFMEFLLMLIPLIVTTFISLILFRTVGAPLTKAEKNDASDMPAFCWLLALLAAIIGGCFYINTDIGVFLKILSSIGLNFVPGFASLMMIGNLDE